MDRLWYRLYRPEGLEGDKAPLIVFLHGAGEGGDDKSTLHLVAKHCLPHLAEHGQLPEVEDGRFPFLIAAPQTRSGRWADEADRLDKLVSKLADEEGVDLDHLYLTGISKGAIGCWDLALQAPSRYAAILPVSWDVGTQAGKVRSAVWVIVGKQDSQVDVPPDEVEEKLYRDRARDDRTRFSALDGNHSENFWNPLYARADLYQWLRRYSRPD